MRKYQQVALLALALMSIVGLTIYRKQYVDLRRTLEGFKIFGRNEKPDGCMVLNDTINLDKLKYTYTISGWIKLENDFYVYSAFWKGNGYAKALGIGPKKHVPDFGCHIWYDYGDSLFAIKGSFSYKESEVSGSSLNVFEFICDIGSVKSEGSPYMFVFIKEKIKQFVPLHVGDDNELLGSVAMCVYPDYTGISKVSIIDFIAYHQIVGFTDFIIYDQIHYGILHKMKSLLTDIGLLKSFTVLPWLFPGQLVDLSAKLVAELDCLHRLSDKVSLVAVLNFHDYIVPTIEKKINHTVRNNDSSKLKFKYQTCCTNMNNDRRSEESWPVVLKKTQCLINNEIRRVLINPKQDISFPSEAVINSYQLCSSNEKSNVAYDGSSRKFLDKLLKSKLILLRNSGTLV